MRDVTNGMVLDLDGTDESETGADDGAITVTVASDPGGAYSFLWSTGDTTATISGLSAGSYQLTVTDTDGCEIEENINLISLAVSISEELNQQLAVYPNPTDGNIKVELSHEAGIESYKLLDLQGRLMKAGSVGGAKELEVERENLMEGVYFLRIKLSDGREAVRKIVYR